ncbi:hypothetical protein [Halosimplex pelagicum]|uniref:Uncharacterized protein n=1 Tax=Halosimplex pelagicum TaxID=869886 RepID=A0A7D5TW68_9EURY|nr:hypothetical protein [Halosimplex pelagicum]QLH83774.1 hypothetical protein HZS54_20020 [Halosimplex pelagicum]
MKDRTDLLQVVSIDQIGSGELPDKDGGLLLDLGSGNLNPRGTYELIQGFEENGLMPSQVKALKVESSELGRLSTGSGDVYKKATDPQKKQEFGKKDLKNGFEPGYVVVSAPERTFRGKEASIEDTVEQLQAAQDTIRDVDEPVDYTGKILLENRPRSIFSNVGDLLHLQLEAMEQGFTPLYSFDRTVDGGEEMLSKAVFEDVRMIRTEDGYEIWPGS